MAANSANDYVVKIGDGATSETFTKIAALTANSMSLNNNMVDITTKDSAHQRTILSDGGVQSMSVNGSGIFTDDSTEETLRANASANTLNNLEIVFGNGDKYAGSFLITNYGRDGNVDDKETYSFSLESSGTVTFTAA